MRSKKFKVIVASALVAAAAVTATAVALKEPVVRYITGAPEIAVALEETELQQLSGSTAVLELPEAQYIIQGSAADGGYSLDIQAKGIYAYAGRFALAFDTTKLALDGPDSLSAFQTAAGVTAVPEVYPESAMVSNENGYACLAWYCSGMDATSEPKTVATLNFRFLDGCSEKDIDAGSFRLMAVESGDMGPFESAASFEGQGTLSTIPYAYMTQAQPCGVSFDYDGSDRTPEDGHKVIFRCANNLGEDVEGLLELNGRTYLINGSAAVVLADGEYLWRIQSSGYGAETGRLTVAGDEIVELTFVTDETLVREAAADLDIGYQLGDSAERVTSTLQLPTLLEESGVSVAWESSVPGVITNEGLVYLPDETGTEVTLTAALTRGEAAETVSFTVYVCSKAELQPVQSSDGDVKQEQPAEPDVPASGEGTEPVAVKFTDLDGYDWAKDSITELSAAGVIKGTSETTFTPAANIRRGDFVLMLMRMLDVETTKTTETFTDVPEDSYYFEAITQAKALGIAEGTGSGRFEPDATITRQDMITLTMRAIDKTGYLAKSSETGDLSAFKDSSLVAEYAEGSMKAAVGRGLIIGDNEKLNPLGNTTRAETAVFLQRILSAHQS